MMWSTFLALLLWILSDVVNPVYAVDNIDFVGCYDPSYALLQRYHYHILPLSLNKCVGKCKALKTKYAGLDTSSNFCYCGVDIAEGSAKVNDSLCNEPCPGASTRTCGGDWLMSLYDIHQTFPPDDDDEINFLIGISNGVRLYNSSDLERYNTLMHIDGWAYSVDYHYRKNLVFAFSKNQIYKSTLISKAYIPYIPAEQSTIKAQSRCEALAVDWVLDRLYWVDCSNGSNTVVSTNLDGEDTRTVLVRPEAAEMIKRIEIDPYKGVLFWTADGTIESCDLSGNNFQTNMSQAGVTVRAMTLDLQARRVFFVGAMNQTTSLFSMGYTGDDAQMHFSMEQMRSVYGLGILKGRLYWVNYVNVRDVIYTSSLQLNSTPGDVKMMKSIDRAVWHMKIVHPDIQKQVNINPCEHKGCSHQCVASTRSMRSAMCQCPPNLTLGPDHLTCLVTTRSWVLPASFIIITVVLLVSIVLFYLGDRYWPLLQVKLAAGVSYDRKRDCERENSATPVYDVADDNVNLV